MQTIIRRIFSVIFLLLVIFFLPAIKANTSLADMDLKGAWGYESASGKTVMICSGNIFSVATYDIAGKKMISSYGGTWLMDGNNLKQKIEWNSKDSTQVGTEIAHPVQLTSNTLSLAGMNEKWQRLDNGGPGELSGAWVITGNYSNDKVSKRANPFYPRRTMKVLSGKYFHWIAYNVATKQFLHASGGTYTTAGAKYTENIEFFTKTPGSVGKSLVFDYSFVDGDWRHRGEKSTGGAMDECWTKREKLDR